MQAVNLIIIIMIITGDNSHVNFIQGPVPRGVIGILIRRYLTLKKKSLATAAEIAWALNTKVGREIKMKIKGGCKKKMA